MEPVKTLMSDIHYAWLVTSSKTADTINYINMSLSNNVHGNSELHLQLTSTWLHHAIHACVAAIPGGSCLWYRLYKYS